MELKLVIGKKRHSQIITDQGSGVEIELFYRLPTNKERITFARKAMVRKGRKFIINNQAVARSMVQGLLKSFDWPDKNPDTRVHFVQDGKLVPLSCKEGDPGYREDWREILERALPQILEHLGNKLFAGVGGEVADIVFGDDETEEETALDDEAKEEADSKN